MNFEESIIVCFKKYADFEGRASRSEYWWFMLFTIVIGLPFDLYSKVTGNYIPVIIIQIFMLTPGIAVLVRRLHDTNKSGWNYLWIITIIGMIPILIWLCTKSDSNENKYGILKKEYKEKRLGIVDEPSLNKLSDEERAKILSTEDKSQLDSKPTLNKLSDEQKEMYQSLQDYKDGKL